MLEPRGMEAQSAVGENAIGTGIKKQHSLEGVANDGNAVLGISPALRIAARKSDGITQHRYANGPRGRLTKAVQASIAVISDLLLRSDGNKRDRGDGANVKPADDRLSAHIETAEGRRFPAAASGA